MGDAMSDFDANKWIGLGLQSTLAALETAERQLADCRSILSDLLTERGESWLAQLVGRREELLSTLRDGERMGDYEICGSCHSLDPTERGNFDDGLHVARCPLASLLRIVGGPDEVARQVDAAHEAAMVDAAYEAALNEQAWQRSRESAYEIMGVNQLARSITIGRPGHSVRRDTIGRLVEPAYEVGPFIPITYRGDE